MNQPAFGLTPRGHHHNKVRVGLRSVAMEATADPLLTHITVDQQYINQGSDNIEVVYTFPLPLEATLTGVTVELAGKTLTGTAVATPEATEKYEDAVSTGDSAVLVTSSSPGLYTMNLGNLLPGEPASIQYTYALPNRWHQGQLSLCLPTTIAPRFGDPAAAGLQPHEVPPVCWDNGVQFSFNLTLVGELANATVASPTHGITSKRSGDGLTIALADSTAAMDRDLVVNIQADAPANTATVVRSGDEWLVLAALTPAMPAQTEQRPMALLVDCSGSMGGDSITQAREGAIAALATVPNGTLITAIAFGSHTVTCPDTPAVLDSTVRTRVAQWLGRLDANLGGTETEQAIRHALQQLEGSCDLLLLTDGHVYSRDLAPTKESHSRVFPVAVGAAANLADLTAMATDTGGFCERITPLEDTSTAMQRQAQRMRCPMHHQPEISWSGANPGTVAADPIAWGGDTWLLAARCTTEPSGTIQLGDGTATLAAATLQPAANNPALAAIAAHRLLAELPKEDATALAVAHNLLSEHTSYLVVAERDVKAGDLPELVQQGHTMAAGYGGSASLAMCSLVNDLKSFGAPAKQMSMDDFDYCDEAPEQSTSMDTQRTPRAKGVKFLVSRRRHAEGEHGRVELLGMNRFLQALLERDDLSAEEREVLEFLKTLPADNSPEGQPLWLTLARMVERRGDRDPACRALRKTARGLPEGEQLNADQFLTLRKLVARHLVAA